MAEKIIPFARTVLLPAGSPAIGCVDGLRMDVSGLQCQSNGQACYCLGDADLLIEYHAAPSDCGSLFYGPSEPGRAWQALLSIPLELHCSSAEGPLPLPPGSYQPSLRHLEWFMVASNAIELEGSLLLTWEAAEAAAPAAPPAEEAESPAPVEAEPEPEMEASVETDPESEPKPQTAEEKKPSAEEVTLEGLMRPEGDALPRGMICRPEHFGGRGKQAYQSRGWTMVNYSEDKTSEKTTEKQLAAEDAAVETQIQNLAARAEQTAAEARQLWKEIEQRQSEQSEQSGTEEDAASGPGLRESQETPPNSADAPPSVTLEARQLQEALSLSLSGEDGDTEDEEREIDLREGVVVRMRFDPPSALEQKKLYYPGPVPEQSPDPKILAETLQEALGEEGPRPSARLSFSWETKAEEPEISEAEISAAEINEKKTGEEINEAAPLPAAPPQELADEISILAEEAASNKALPEEEIEDSRMDSSPPASEEQKAQIASPAEEVPERGDQAAPLAPPRERQETESTAPEEKSACPLAEAEQRRASQNEVHRPETPSESRELPAPPTPASGKEQRESPSEEAASPQMEPPRVEADQLAMTEALDTALEPELLPPAEKRSRRRRAVGLPRLHIDARDNTVEISAFNLQIKL